MTIYEFLSSIFSKIKGKVVKKDELPLQELAEEEEMQCPESFEEEDLEEQINVAKRTLMAKLYTLEQDIAVFANDFPFEYQNFLQRIDVLRTSYYAILEELQKDLTFEVDPESSSAKLNEIIRLERDIKKFIESTVKFHIISNRLQRLIRKLNILYNVSIFRSKKEEKQKVCTQLRHAIQVERNIAEEFKTSDYILSDKQRKERIIELLSYLDYEIFKSSIRNSNQTPETIIGGLVMLEKFEEFDYQTTFIAYLKDELSDLLELLSLISDTQYYELLKTKSEKLQLTLTYTEDVTKTLFEIGFWNEFLTFESTLLETLKICGIPEEKRKVKLIDRIQIEVEEEDVFVSPMARAKLAFVSVFSVTQDKRILLLMKLFENLSEDITYKEIYFLLLIFDGLEIIQNTPNDLMKYIEKYINKKPYSKSAMIEKRKMVKNISPKEYVVLFPLDENAEEIMSTLRSLNIDFKVENNNIFLNSFYFQDLKHVLSNLKTNTSNMKMED